jgi:hypothetical protein
MMTARSALCLLLVKPLAVAALLPRPRHPQDEGKSSSTSTSSSRSSSESTEQSASPSATGAEKMILLPPWRKTKTKNPTVAATR